MRALSTLVGLLVFNVMGCGSDISSSISQPQAGTSKTAATETSPTGDPIAEVSAEGWPHTTKQHRGELVYVAPDGTEEITGLGNDTIAHVKNTFHAGKPDELKYRLHYLRHRNGNDLYQLHYSWKTGENGSEGAETGPVMYSGDDETTISDHEHGKFVIRPESK